MRCHKINPTQYFSNLASRWHSNEYAHRGRLLTQSWWLSPAPLPFLSRIKYDRDGLGIRAECIAGDESWP
jgi:hypothetical protein